SFHARPRVKARGARPVVRERRAWPALGAPPLMKLQPSSNSRNSWRDTPALNRRNDSRGKEAPTMGLGLRSAVALLAVTSASLVSSSGWAGDDGDAPLWKGVSGIFAPILGPAVGFGF